MTSRAPAPADQPVLVNRTGLTLNVSITEGGQTTTVPVEPLGSAGHSLRSGTGAQVTVTDAASGRLILQASADPEQLPVLLTPAQLALAESSAAAAVPVEFRNDSGEYADLCRVERTGEIRLAAAVPPAATARVQSGPGEVLVARSCFDELLLGTWFADAQAGPLVAGPGLREAAVRVLPPSPYPGITKLELVSQPRPEPDPAASQFVQVSSQDNQVLDLFNGRSDVLTRDVTIVGVELQWSRARTQHVTRDYGHATAVAHDIEHLMIHADRVVIGCPLFLPGTDVTIHARVLEFTGDGCLNTTPRPHLQARATPASPGKDRPIGYKAADGLKGQRAGSVTLRVGSVRAPAGAVVIRAGGSAGQAAEAGGWLDYTKRGAGQPEPLKNSAEPPAYAPLTMKAIEDVFASDYGGVFRELSVWDWPSQGPGLGQYANIERDGRWPLAEGRVVSCSIIAWQTAASHAAVDVFKFVNNVGERIYHASNEFDTENPDPRTLVTWPEVAKGRDAYPGGQPGTGGAGGTVQCSVPLAPEHCDLAGGPAGQKSDEVQGGPASQSAGAVPPSAGHRL